MKRRVINGFLDKYSRVRYAPDEMYESDDPARLAFLTENGYLAGETPPEPAAEEVQPRDSGRRKNRAKNKPDADGL